jgi:hypothetical protein
MLISRPLQMHQPMLGMNNYISVGELLMARALSMHGLMHTQVVYISAAGIAGVDEWLALLAFLISRYQQLQQLWNDTM